MQPATAPTAPPAHAATAAPVAAQATELQLATPAALLCAAQAAVGTLQECAIWAKAGGWTKAAATIQRRADELQAALSTCVLSTPPPAALVAASCTAVHPTQAAPLCKDCAHMQSDLGYLKCGHPSQPRNTTNGNPYRLCESVRNRTAEQAAESKDLGFCGQSGLLFAPAHPGAHP